MNPSGFTGSSVLTICEAGRPASRSSSACSTTGTSGTGVEAGTAGAEAPCQDVRLRPDMYELVGRAMHQGHGPVPAVRGRQSRGHTDARQRGGNQGEAFCGSSDHQFPCTRRTADPKIVPRECLRVLNQTCTRARSPPPGPRPAKHPLQSRAQRLHLGQGVRSQPNAAAVGRRSLFPIQGRENGGSTTHGRNDVPRLDHGAGDPIQERSRRRGRLSRPCRVADRERHARTCAGRYDGGKPDAHARRAQADRRDLRGAGEATCAGDCRRRLEQHPGGDRSRGSCGEERRRRRAWWSRPITTSQTRKASISISRP